MSSIETTSDNSLVSSDSETEEQKEFNPLTFFSRKELLLYKSIDNFMKTCTFEQKKNMVDMINSKSDISLRVLDWFTTKYSKRKIDFKMKKDTHITDIHISYKAQLKTYKKKYFDPFRRNEIHKKKNSIINMRKVHTSIQLWDN